MRIRFYDIIKHKTLNDEGIEYETTTFPDVEIEADSQEDITFLFDKYFATKLINAV